MAKHGLTRLNSHSDTALEASKQQALIRLKLEAQQLFGLYEKLLTIKEFRLREDYALRSLLEVGGQGVLFLADDLRHDGFEVVVKMPLVPYHRQAYIDEATIHQARNELRQEAFWLSLFSGTILPEIYEDVEDVNPLYDSAWAPEISRHERYLVMESIRGDSLDQERQILHTPPQIDYLASETLAWAVADQVLAFSDSLWTDERCLYTDMRPQNIMLTRDTDRRGQPGWRRRFRMPERALPPCKTDTAVRIIDAGSIVRARERVDVFPYHPAYLLPAAYKAIQEGECPTPDPRLVMYALGKSLFQFLTNQEPLPGRDPDLSDPEVKDYSESLKQILHGMIHGAYSGFGEARAAVIKGIEAQPLPGE